MQFLARIVRPLLAWLLLSVIVAGPGCGDSSPDGLGGAGGTGGAGGDGMGGDGSGTLELLTDCASAVPFRLCSATGAMGAALDVPDGPVTAALTGSEGAEVIATAVSGTVTFMVPNTPAGAAEVRFELPYAAAFATLEIIESPVVDDPEVVLADFAGGVDGLQNALENFFDSPLGAPNAESGSADLSKAMATWGAAWADVSALNSEERKVVAAVLVANPEFLKALTDMTDALLELSVAQSTLECQATLTRVANALLHWRVLLTGLGAGVMTGLAVSLALPAAPLLAVSLGAVAAVATVIAVADFNLLETIKQLYDCFITEVEEAPQGAPATFQSGVPRPLMLTVVARNLQASDASSSVGWLQSGVTTILEVAPVLAKLLPWKSPFAFASEKTLERSVTSVSSVAVSIQENAAVAGSVGGTPQAPQLTLTSSSSMDENATYSLTYTEGDFVVSTADRQVTVKPDTCSTTVTATNVNRTCTDPDTGLITTTEQCVLNASDCVFWEKKTFHANSQLSEWISVSNGGEDYAEESRDEQARVLATGGCRVPLSGSDNVPGAGGWQKDYTADTCRYFAYKAETTGAIGCDTGIVPGTSCDFAGCNWVLGGPTFTCADVKPMASIGASDVTIIQEGLCGTTCEFLD